MTDLQFPNRLDWFNLYGQSWKSVIPDEAQAHPAKFSRKLIHKIYQHLGTLGLAPGSTIVDPFAGIGLGALAIAYGYNWTGVELEKQFYRLAIGHDCSPAFGIAALARALVGHRPPPMLFNAPVESHFKGVIEHAFAPLARHGAQALMVHGDSRELGRLVKTAQALVSSPLFATNSGGPGSASLNSIYPGIFDRHQGSRTGGIGSKENGNLAALSATQAGFDALVSSPPYAEIKGRETPENREDIDGASPANFMGTNKTRSFRYGSTPGQVGRMPTGSHADALVTSPPFLDSTASAPGSKRGGLLAHDPKRAADATLQAEYGNSKGQLASEGHETFWTASQKILQEAYALLTPGAFAVFVCKDTVKGGQIFEFSRMWAELCQAQGFIPHTHARAWQVQKFAEQALTTGGYEVVKKQHKSFFRLLQEKKGSPEINHEDILIFTK